ncbi:LL-diaminopimelate aminotransferase [Alcanivorax sp. ALC70]|nr:succinyldiaminopimelate transaminase [Alcanivorax sp.]MBI54183.1 succinyldiaminopimelate transaminase [Alcanivorax sp.]UWN48327.1 LL-diaminopimelate aminotransferase [Alcanivorax sp. ALC70]HCE39306.1 succinyldiaminopimelate transaminase [Alcanivorax sp.]|tara:strand:- start:15700 stop:16881 length:1182 start_codon:yes stop_codon:yes gene_type:complete
MNPDLERLHPYPFEKLGALFAGVTPADKPPIALSIGEPQHPSPAFVQQALRDNTALLAKYPATAGLPELRQAIAGWLTRRFKLESVDADHQVLPVNGTREALFAFAQALLDRRRDPLVLMPNPFYQIYEGAALLGGGEPVYLPCTQASGLQPDFDAVDEDVWRRTQLLFICTPGNPTGAVLTKAQLKALIQLADKYDFVIASDECYSEIYRDQAPPGLLQACAELGRHDYRRCVVFHSLSKRSNLPGLRSGFVAGDAEVLAQFLRYRTYHGCAMPVHHQLASVAAWNDEAHVQDNRDFYNAKFDAVLDILGEPLKVSAPDAGFYLWPKTPVDDETFARRLKAEENVTVLPGRYLSRAVDGRNPGKNRVRLALVAELDQCIEGARRIRALIERL